MTPQDKDRAGRTSRRAFLRGRSALEALRDVTARHLPDDNAEPRVDSSDPQRYLTHLARRAMACEFAVFLNAGQDVHGPEHALAALDLVEQLEAHLSLFRDTSQVCHINRTAATKEVVVERELFDLLRKAVQISDETGGAFDITTGPLSQVWGFHQRSGHVPTSSDLSQSLQTVGYRHLLLDELRQTIRFDRPGIALDLGAIGKGYALDRCAQQMAGHGIRDYLLHGGQSSLLAAGSRSAHPTAGWPIAVRHPLQPEKTLARLYLHDRALGTSGIMHQHFQVQRRRLGHILDPRSGQPVEGFLSCTILADSATEADALATAFFVMGLDQAEAYCQSHPEIDALFVRSGVKEASLVALGANPDIWFCA